MAESSYDESHAEEPHIFYDLAHHTREVGTPYEEDTSNQQHQHPKQLEEEEDNPHLQDPEYHETLKHEGWKDLTEKPRWCTDILFWLLIIASWITMTVVGFCAVGIFKSGPIPAGYPDRLIYPTDYQGSICGQTPGVKDKKYGYYLPDATAVCVKSCPSETDYDSFYCQYNIQSSADNSTLVAWENVAQYRCMYQIKTINFVHRCLPNVNDLSAVQATATQEALTYGVNETAIYSTSTNRNTNWYTDFIGDIYSLLGYVFGFGIGVTVGVALLYLLLLQVKGLLFLVLWIAILGVFVLLIIGSFLLWSLANQWNSDGIHSHPEIITMRVFAFFGMGLCAIYFCLIVVLRKRIQLAIGIVKQAARALASMPSLFFVPVVQTFGIVCFLVPWVIYVLALASSGSEVTNTASYTYEGQTFSYTYKTFSYKDNTRWAFLYMLFCWFWTSEFIVAMGQLIVALSFSLWYFSRDKSILGHSQTRWAFWTAIIYHQGTAALGSLLVAIVKTVRTIVLYLANKAKKQKNKVVQFILCILSCLLWCLEKILKFINKNAYIMTAIYGYSFCPATRKAFFLLLRNVLRVSAVGIVSTFVILIGKILIPLISTFLCYLAIAYALSSHNVSGIIAPLVFTFLLSYWVSTDEEMFPVQDRFAEGELRTTIEKAAKMHLSLTRAGSVKDHQVEFEPPSTAVAEPVAKHDHTVV